MRVSELLKKAVDIIVEELGDIEVENAKSIHYNDKTHKITILSK